MGTHRKGSYKRIKKFSVMKYSMMQQSGDRDGDLTLVSYDITANPKYKRALEILENYQYPQVEGTIGGQGHKNT